MVPVLPSFMVMRPRGAAPESWVLFSLAAEVTDIAALMGAIDILRGQGLTGPVIVCTFIERRILPLRERSRLLWTYEGLTNPMMEFQYPISDMVLRGLMLDATSLNYPGVPPFGADRPHLANHPFTGMVSEYPALPSEDR